MQLVKGLPAIPRASMVSLFLRVSAALVNGPVRLCQASYPPHPPETCPPLLASLTHCASRPLVLSQPPHLFPRPCLSIFTPRIRSHIPLSPQSWQLGLQPSRNLFVCKQTKDAPPNPSQHTITTFQDDD